MSTLMEDAYMIEGGNVLSGTVRVSGAKNVALKTVIAALLFSGPVTLQNIPHIRDIDELLHLLTELGAQTRFTPDDGVQIDPTTLSHDEVSLLHGSKIRTSFLLFAPLLYRFGRARIPNPGGCRIGARPIDRIVDGMRQVGIEVTYDHSSGYYTAQLRGKPHGDYTFEKPSHTGTEFMIMLSVFCEGTIRIQNAALEPEIDDLIGFLNEAGARITRDGSTILICGVDRLVQQKPYVIMGDRNEAVTYSIMGLITGGEVTVQGVSPEMLTSFHDALKRCGCPYEVMPDGGLRYRRTGAVLSPTQVETQPHPGFMTDWQPNWAVLMTQASGVSTIHERVFENRFAYVEELRKLGAGIEFDQTPVPDPTKYYYFNYDPHKEYSQRIRIEGPRTLHNGVLKINDLRAGATLAIAALLAPGESAITGVSILERGYERFIEKVQLLGGVIKKV